MKKAVFRSRIFVQIKQRIFVQIFPYIAGLPFVRRIAHDGTTIHLLCDNGPHNLANILGVLQQRAVVFGRVYSEPPTLNDVFLEITGKELRD